MFRYSNTSTTTSANFIVLLNSCLLFCFFFCCFALFYIFNTFLMSHSPSRRLYPLRFFSLHIHFIFWFVYVPFLDTTSCSHLDVASNYIPLLYRFHFVSLLHVRPFQFAQEQNQFCVDTLLSLSSQPLFRSTFVDFVLFASSEPFTLLHIFGWLVNFDIRLWHYLFKLNFFLLFFSSRFPFLMLLFFK